MPNMEPDEALGSSKRKSIRFNRNFKICAEEDNILPDFRADSTGGQDTDLNAIGRFSGNRLNL